MSTVLMGLGPQPTRSLSLCCVATQRRQETWRRIGQIVTDLFDGGCCDKPTPPAA